MIAFNKNFTCNYGVAERIAPQIRRILARNPSPFTFHGTGTYIVGQGNVAIVDPGPNDIEHIGAVMGALHGEKVTHILVTHTHLDHSPGCRLLKQYIDAPTYGYGPHGAGQILSNEAVEEGADKEFIPDFEVRHGDVMHGDDWSIECVHTPGHTSNHICYQLRERRILFCGDHIMAWATTIISPPDGNLSDYFASLDLLLQRDDEMYLPCHGPCIDDPKPFVKSYIQHREQRIDQVLDCLKEDVVWISDMVRVIYTALPDTMHPAAARSVLSTLIYLIDQGIVISDSPSLDATYRLAP